MKVYTVKDRKEIIASYLAEKVIIVPTDTIYGMTCIISSPVSKARIFKVKGRSEKMYLSVIVSSVRMAKNFIDLPREDLKLFKKNETITIIGNIKDDINKLYNITEDNTIGIRITKSKWLKKIINKVGPIYGTSVNISGQNYAKEFNDLQKFNVDIIVDAGYLDNRPSKIYNSLTKEFIR
ncbi:L-threonylcarbamoyladenylate synthase [Spiroplasma melliferum]|uniref:L-threonylcarbamoyladenylate synthase n=1 Tax=Spiroplasma melliferum TaxID=2134 RepID=UPI0002A62DCC|nr:Sua5/YciO/YrdC/YwlC family protein [Spiroplasma melliferum]ELL44739.1 Sua5/YciO/YrdC/YwlC family protein [Spiroplasma melliferum IPMB4A]